MRKTLRIALILLFPLVISGCFNIIHFIDVGKDGQVQVRWRMSVSSALTEMGKMQGGAPGAGDEGGSLGDDLQEAEMQIKDSLKGVAEKVQVKKFENDQSQGIDVTLSVKNLDGLKAKAMPEDEMPIVPIYDAAKKQLVFRFTPDNTQKLQGPGAAGKADDTSTAKHVEEGPLTEGAEEAGDADVTGEDAESDEVADPMQGMEQLGEKLGQLFASAATYDIFLGSGFKVREAYLRDMSGTKQSAIEVIPLGEQSLVRFPLLGMISQDGNQKGFEIVVQLR